jgi:4'-phosphopantetheinyl transferase
MPSKLEWYRREGQPPFSEGDVEIWLAEMGPATEPTSVLLKNLSSSERARASGFALERDARRFVFQHAVLRSLLGFYLQEDPRAIEIEISASGKPLLPEDAQVKIAMSYAGMVAIFGVSRRAAIGIDIERINAIDQGSTLIESFFTFDERQAIRQIPSGLQLEAFYKCWCRKEALLKATGNAFCRNLGPEGVYVVLDDGPRSFGVLGDQGMARWTVISLPAIDGYTAAIAIEGDLPSVSTWIADEIIGAPLAAMGHGR